MGMVRRSLPWLASAAVHAALAGAAFLTVAGLASGPPASLEPDATYAVALRPGGEPHVDGPITGDERTYGAPQDSVIVNDAPLKGVPDLKFGGASSSELRVSSQTPKNLSHGFGRGTNTNLQVVGDAVPLETPSPLYPNSARRGHLQGTVIAEIRIDAEGHVETARAAEGSGSSILDEAALTAVRAWRYRPATLGGRPVPSVRRVRFVFRLE